MSIWAAAGGAASALLLNECCELSPWAADKMVRWSARLRYSDPGRAEVRAEELSALIKDRPGKLFKLITALCFAAAALRAWTQRAAAGLSLDRPSISASGAVSLKKAAVAAAACTAAVGMLASLPSASREPAQVPGVTQNAPSGATSRGSQSSKALAMTIGGLLATGANNSELLAAATSDAQDCSSPNLQADVGQIRQVRDQRQTELAAARALHPGHRPKSVALKSGLIQSMTSALRIDNTYLVWAENQATATTCVAGSTPPDVVSANNTAAADKTAFLGLWNPTAVRYGLPVRGTGDI